MARLSPDRLPLLRVCRMRAIYVRRILYVIKLLHYLKDTSREFHTMALLNTWLRSSGFWVAPGRPSAGAPPLTHVFLNGGKAVVPDASRAEFLDTYAAAVASGGSPQLFVVERSGIEYRMFADFDVPYGKDGIDDEGGTARMHDLVEHAMCNLPMHLRVGSVAMCMRPAHKGKIGAHFVWSDLRVGDEAALDARDRWVKACIAAPATMEYRWDDIIDAAVYKKNGLRMPWSMKRGENVWSCYTPRCTYIFDDSPHLFRVDSVFEADAWRDAQTVRLWLERTSLMAAFGQVEKDSKSKKTEHSKGCSSSKKRKINEAGIEYDACFSPGDVARLEAALPSQYSGCAFTNVRCGPSTLVISTDSKYCMTAGREHTSNHVYFVARRDGGVYQCCYSKGCAGACNKVSNDKPLSRLAAKLLKDMTKKQKPSLLPVSAKIAAARWSAAVSAAGAAGTDADLEEG